MMSEESLGRWILTSDRLERGYLRVVDGRVEEVCWSSAPDSAAKALILPGLVNSHVHLGDSVAYPAPKGSVQEIVGPPDGHKHRVLRTKSAFEKVEAMRRASRLIRASGTTLFCDFREEGVEGVKALKSAMEGSPVPMRVLGRPVSSAPDDQELKDLLAVCDGIGTSALSDWPYDLLLRMSAKARSTGKSFAMHASEANRENIDKILDLKPDFLVHMCSASDDDLAECVDAGVPIVVCPRSSGFFGLDPGIPRLLSAGATVALGSDNGMIAHPDMIEEVRAAFSSCAGDRRVSPQEIINLATFNGRKVLNAKPKITTEIHEETTLVAVQIKGEDPLLEFVTKSKSEDVLGVAQGGRFRRTSEWTR